MNHPSANYPSNTPIRHPRQSNPTHQPGTNYPNNTQPGTRQINPMNPTRHQLSGSA